MVRPCYLVIDRQFPGSISTRKLVIETAKFNVVTAYSAHEAVETLAMFPAISGVVLDADIHDMTCEELIEGLRKIKKNIPTIVICGPDGENCPSADYLVESYDPRKLLEALRKIEPERVAEIEREEEKLNAKDKNV
jgi:DNA-binding NtrC family response regulator